MMYHFTHFYIHQFRGFQNVNLDNLGRVNLLVGMNNSGKTSVLEALSLYCDPLELRNWIAIAYRRNMGQDFTPSTIETLKWFFPQKSETEEDNEKILMKAQGDFKVRSIQAVFEERRPKQFSSTFMGAQLDIDHDNEDILENAEIKVSSSSSSNQEEGLHEEKRVFSLRENETKLEAAEQEEKVKPSGKDSSEYVLPFSSITPCSHRLKQAQMRQITHAKTAGTIKPLLDMLKQIDPNIENLEILSKDGRRFSVYLQHREIGLAPISLFGEGVQRILALALSLLNVQNGVLLIDELEVGIHHSALQTVFSWLVEACREYNVQLFATTHSLEALDALLATVPDGSDEIVGYRLPTAVTNEPLKRFSGNLLHRLRYERGLDVR